VLVIGELNVDLVASGLHSLLGLGQEVLASDFRVTLGSASAIFACGVARLGHPVTFLSKVGTDDFGRFCINALKEAGISTDQILHSTTSATGVTVVLSTDEDRALVTCLGAIAELRYEQLPFTVFAGHRHLHLTSYFLQHGLRPDFIAIMRDAQQQGLTVS
ncbi:PfkB domain protein, partial [mine drainage metagenome]